jgi:hypothetical protein
VLLSNAVLAILFLSETYAGSTPDKRIAEATPSPLPTGSRLLQDLGCLAFTLNQVEIISQPASPTADPSRAAKKPPIDALHVAVSASSTSTAASSAAVWSTTPAASERRASAI